LEIKNGGIKEERIRRVEQKANKTISSPQAKE